MSARALRNTSTIAIMPRHFVSIRIRRRIHYRYSTRGIHVRGWTDTSPSPDKTCPLPTIDGIVSSEYIFPPTCRRVHDRFVFVLQTAPPSPTSSCSQRSAVRPSRSVPDAVGDAARSECEQRQPPPSAAASEYKLSASKLIAVNRR